jgi:hypothetical protein
MSVLDTADIIDRVLGAGLLRIEHELTAAPRFAGLKRAFPHLVSNTPTKAKLTQRANARVASGKLVFVPMVHEFNGENDAEASSFQQTLASFVGSRANQTTDVLLLEGFRAGAINESNLVRQLRESDNITGAGPRTTAEYARMVSDLRRDSSIVELALRSELPAAGIEHLWVSELGRVAMILEDSKPIGTSMQIAYLLLELRNRIAFARATDLLLKSKRPVIVMGALHAFGIKEAAIRAGIELETWVPEPLVPLLGSR